MARRGGDVHVFFDVAGARLALPGADVTEVLPLPHLVRPPLCPPALAGLLDLSGTMVPVVRTDRLLDLGPGRDGLYSHVLRLRRHGSPVALLVDRVWAVAPVAPADIRPVTEDETLRGCVAAEIAGHGAPVRVLALDRLLAERERQRLAAFAGGEAHLDAVLTVPPGDGA